MWKVTNNLATILQQSCNNSGTILQWIWNNNPRIIILKQSCNNLVAYVYICIHMFFWMRTNTLVTILLQSCNNLALVLYLPTTFDVKNHKLSHLKSSCFTNLVKFKIVTKILRQSCNNPAGCRIVWNLEIGRYLILVPIFFDERNELKTGNMILKSSIWE